MLLNNSICYSCSVKKICKHYHNAINENDISISIDKCEIKSNLDNSKVLDISIPNANSQTYNKPVDNKLTDITLLNSKVYPDIKELSLAKQKEMNVIPVEEPKAICESCGQLAVLSNCTDCGKRICSQCGYTNIDVNTGRPEITCDECFTGTKDNEETTINWNIDSFVNDNKDEVKEENKDVKPTRKQATNKRSTKKSKDK